VYAALETRWKRHYYLIWFNLVHVLFYHVIHTLYSGNLICNTGGFGGNPAMPPSSLSVGLGPPAVRDFYHTKMDNNLVSVYSVFFQPHSTSEPITINNIHIIDLVAYIQYMYNHLLWLFPCTFSVYDLWHAIWSLISTKLSEWNQAAKGRTLEALRVQTSSKPPFFTLLTLLGIIGAIGPKI